MNLPSKVKIGPYKYNLVKTNDTLWIGEEYGLRQVFGLHDYANSQIKVSTKTSKTVTTDTVIHECLHAMMNLINIDFKNTTEEEVVSVLSPVLMGWMQENPKLVEWIMNEDTK